MRSLLVITIAFLLLANYAESKLKITGGCPPDSKQKKPISVPKAGLPFCSSYTDKACCSADDTLAIQDTVDGLIDQKCSSCYSMVAEWKCAECHPAAANFYVGSPSCESSTSLRLCEDYCHAVFDVCKDIPFSMGNNPFYINDPIGKTKEDFCDEISAPEPNCFRGHIPTTRDESCKCTDHKCHLSKKKRDEL